jgi:hypothetical protein
MSSVEIAATRETAAESLPQLAAGLAVVVLTVLALASVSPTFLVEIVVLFCIGRFPGRVEKLSELEPAFLYVSSQDRRARRRLEE